LGDGIATLTGPWVCGCPFTIGSPSCTTTELTDPVIATSATWTAAGSPYIIHGTLTVGSGATLAIESGVIVKFAPGASATINGMLDVSGTPSSLVVFGSINDHSLCGPSSGGSGTPSTGDWTGLLFTEGSSATIDNALVRHAQSGLKVLTVSAAAGKPRAPEYGGPVIVNNLTVELCAVGVWAAGSSSPVFTNFNASRAEVWIEGNSHPTFTGGVWDGGGVLSQAGYLRYGNPNPGDTPDPTFSGVTLQNMQAGLYPAMRIEAWSDITGTTHWAGIPFVLGSSFTVALTGHVNASDTTVYSLGNWITVNGTMNLGSSGTTTLFRSFFQTPNLGDWTGISYLAGSSGSVTNTTIRHAQIGLSIETANPLMVTASTFESDVVGLQAGGASMPRIQRSSFVNDSTAVRAISTASPDLGMGAQASEGYNTLIGSALSLENLSLNSISAEYNWWGCATSAEMAAGNPNITLIYDQADNPGSGPVDYSHWLGASSRTIAATKDTQGSARDVILTWSQEPTGILAVLRGTDPLSLSPVGSTSGSSWRDPNALDAPGIYFYRVDGPCP
jgi:hypothetical protein